MDIHQKLKNIIQNQPVCIFGCSTEGISSARFLLSHQIPVTIYDRKLEGDFAKIFQELSGTGARFQLGPKSFFSIQPQSYILRTPGMPLWSTELEYARSLNCIISSQTILYFDLHPQHTIGITGTKGKGTTTALIAEIISKSGGTSYVCGNIGTPPLDFLDMVTDQDWFVMELSSFQLEDLHRSPEIGVVLMVTQDHLASDSFDSPNFHHNIKEYLAAKSNLVKYQQKNNLAILNADYPSSLAMIDICPGRIQTFSRSNIAGDGAWLYIDDSQQSILLKKGSTQTALHHVENAKLRGLHNRENMMAAVLVARELDIEIETISSTVASFPGLEHRLEFVAKHKDITYYNDSFSTTPETAIAAISAFNEPMILIAGGSEKGSDFSPLGKAIRTSTVKQVLLIGSMAEKIEKALKDGGNQIPVKNLGSNLTMNEIVNEAEKYVQPGYVVLLSPACASFDMFPNYKERGRLFKEAVYALAHKT